MDDPTTAATAWVRAGTRPGGIAGTAARLELMQRALLRGASPAEAARYALTAMLTGAPLVDADLDGAERSARVLRLPGRLFLGGPGWRALEPDPGLAIADGMAAAADDIERAVL